MKHVVTILGFSPFLKSHYIYLMEPIVISSCGDNLQTMQLAYLITGFLDHSLSATEMDYLYDWVGENDINLATFKKLTSLENINKALEQFRGIVPDRFIENVKDRIHLNFL